MRSCKDFYDVTKETCKNKILKNNLKPYIHIFQVGNNKESDIYVKYKINDCIDCGIQVHLHKYPEDIETKYLHDEIDKYYGNKIVQLPIPNDINFNFILDAIEPKEDIDGFLEKSWFKPCTAKGIFEWLEWNGYELNNKIVTVVGRGITSGGPILDYLRNKDCTVICCNSSTSKDTLYNACKHSDLIISCTGINNLITSDMIRTNTICIDVGRGDFEISISEIPNVYLTPKIGGVGLLTRAALLENICN